MVKDAFVIEVKQSVGLLRYLIAMHSLFLVTIVLSPIAWYWRVLLCLILLLSFIRYYQSHYKMIGRYTVSELTLLDGEWSIEFGDGRLIEDLGLRQSFVLPQLVILYFKASSSWKTRAVYLFADQVDEEVLRQLRVHCRAPKTYQQ